MTDEQTNLEQLQQLLIADAHVRIARILKLCAGPATRENLDALARQLGGVLPDAAILCHALGVWPGKDKK